MPAWAAIVIAAVLHGCAFNDIGLVSTRHYENDTAVMVDLEAWGAQLITAADDGGLTLGYSRRKYIFRRADGEVSVPLSALTDGAAAGEMRPMSCPCPSLDALGKPFFSAKRVTGLTFDTNPNRVGVNLGMRQSAVLVLPSDGSEVVLIKYSNSDDAALRAIVSKEVDR